MTEENKRVIKEKLNIISKVMDISYQELADSYDAISGSFLNETVYSEDLINACKDINKKEHIEVDICKDSNWHENNKVKWKTQISGRHYSKPQNAPIHGRNY